MPVGHRFLFLSLFRSLEETKDVASLPGELSVPRWYL